MSNLKAFMLPKKDLEPKGLEVKLARYPEPFILQSITEAENKALRANAHVNKKNFKTGQTEKEFNQEKYMIDLVVACLKEPNLEEAEIQNHYGVIGAGDTLQVMLTSGEYATLLEAVQQVNGFFEEGNTINDLTKQAKNS